MALLESGWDSATRRLWALCGYVRTESKFLLPFGKGTHTKNGSCVDRMMFARARRSKLQPPSSNARVWSWIGLAFAGLKTCFMIPKHLDGWRVGSWVPVGRMC